MNRFAAVVFIVFAAGLLFAAHAQHLGKIVDDKEAIVFPDNTLGVDLMFGEGGFGLGGFYRKQLSDRFTFYTDFSISEGKDEQEVEYIDYWGNIIVPNKKNRVFLMPLNFGLQYRLFSESLTDNLRPYISLGAGPTLVFTSPYSREFFNAFGYGQAHYTLGGYVGIGANFGINQKNLVGVSLRYYVISFFDEGIESLEGKFQKTLGGFYISINIGTMY